MFRLVVLALFLVLTVGFTGCGGDNKKNQETIVFSEFTIPATEAEAEAWITEMAVSAEQIRSKVMAASPPEWENEIMPLYDFMKNLNDAANFSTVLMQRSHDSAVRALGYSAYQEFPRIQSGLVSDSDFKTAVETALNTLVPENYRQKTAADYLNFLFKSPYSIEQQIAASEAKADLTAASLPYYNNVVTRSATGVFTADEFSCLTDDIKSLLSSDLSGNYIFDANDNALYYTLMSSCLEESVRERIHAVYTSKAAVENSALWPDILERRLIFANASGFDTYSSMRLSAGMLQAESEVRELLDQIKTISDPAFERVKERFKNVQEGYEGSRPSTVFMWNRDRYEKVVQSQVSGDTPVNPGLLTYPETFDRMLYLLGKIVGLRFVKTGTPDERWNDDVVEYLVYDQTAGFPVGTLLVDPYRIDGLAGNAFATYVNKPRVLNTGEKQAPVVLLSTELSKSNTGSTRITSSNYIDFGHELGHVFHFMLNPENGIYQNDFVEVPSHFFEKLVQHPDFFKALLSSDPDTPLEEIPEDFSNYWRYYREYPVGICENIRWTLAISSIVLDMTTWATGSPTDLGEAAKVNLQHYYYPYSSQAEPFYNLMHLINPTTDANYHLYLLGEVIAQDFLSVFNLAAGDLFDQDVGKRYRYHILENSHSDSEAAISDFLGRDWNYSAFQHWLEEKTENL